MYSSDIGDDIRDFKNKLVGPFTARQIGCLVAGAGLAILVHEIVLPDVSWTGNMLWIAILIMAPFLALGWCEPYGLPLEKYLSIRAQYYLSPKTRHYVSEVKAKKHPHKLKEIKKSKKKIKEYD